MKTLNRRDKLPLELAVTLWPSFSHFPDFAFDKRISSIRLNSAMMSSPELEQELKLVDRLKPSVPLFFDIKGRQLRVEEVHFNERYLDITLNHAISVKTPVPVLFKAGMDGALLERLEEGGKRLIFRGGPQYMVRAGESLHIRDKSLVIYGPLFTNRELEKIDRVRAFGFDKYYLSYVEEQSDIDQFLELVGRDALVYLKIESLKGLEFVARKFRKRDNLVLVAARGDLYVEIDKPHQILTALKLIIEKDREACVGSRMLLSVVRPPLDQTISAFKFISQRQNDMDPGRLLSILDSIQPSPVPSCADFSELAWLYDIGYRRMLLCDELCLRGDLLSTAVNAFGAFKAEYAKS
jgi:hypothetical protein